jgi:hypothetical protein
MKRWQPEFKGYSGGGLAGEAGTRWKRFAYVGRNELSRQRGMQTAGMARSCSTCTSCNLGTLLATPTRDVGVLSFSEPQAGFERRATRQRGLANVILPVPGARFSCTFAETGDATSQLRHESPPPLC